MKPASYDAEIARWLHQVVWEAAHQRKVWPAELFGPCRRSNPVSVARRAVILKMRTCLCMCRGRGTIGWHLKDESDPVPAGYRPVSFPLIAELLGLTNHTSALLAWRKADEEIKVAN